MALQKEQDDNIGQIYLFSAAMLYAVTMFAPRMHERYFFPCIIFKDKVNSLNIFYYKLLHNIAPFPYFITLLNLKSSIRTADLA